MLTQKENNLLQDLKKDEQVCIEKYSQYSSSASSQQLKSLFQQLGQNEQQHLNTINQILNGSVPNMNMANTSNANANNQTQTLTQNSNYTDSANKQNDSYLCTDALSTEKYVSSGYNTSIFEFKDANIRNALNHIQKEEQEHGKTIYDYMAQNGMYS